MDQEGRSRIRVFISGHHSLQTFQEYCVTYTAALRECVHAEQNERSLWDAWFAQCPLPWKNDFARYKQEAVETVAAELDESVVPSE